MWVGIGCCGKESDVAVNSLTLLCPRSGRREVVWLPDVTLRCLVRTNSELLVNTSADFGDVGCLGLEFVYFFLWGSSFDNF